MGQGDRTIPRSGSGETIRHKKHDLIRVFIAHRLQCLYCRHYLLLYEAFPILLRRSVNQLV